MTGELRGPRRRLVLVADDEPEIRATIHEALEGAGLHTTGDGEAALALARKSRPDLIILDVMMSLAFAVGAVAPLSKPFPPDTVGEMVRRILDSEGRAAAV